MKRILFVDDDQMVLDGIRNTMFHFRRKWEMVFANSGENALRHIAEDPPFDVIVTDMQMPRVDGLKVVFDVKIHQPRAVCIVLSGYSRYESLSATSVVDAFLPKPCSRSDLHDTIERLCPSGAKP